MRTYWVVAALVLVAVWVWVLWPESPIPCGGPHDPFNTCSSF